jgi:hypothetical protein
MTGSAVEDQVRASPKIFVAGTASRCDDLRPIEAMVLSAAEKDLRGRVTLKLVKRKSG